MELNYAHDIRIDQHCLDQEWIKQPGLYLAYAQAQADAEHEMDKAKEDVEFVESNLDAVAREELESANDGKRVTESAIRAYIAQHEDYRRARRKYHKAKHDFNTLVAATRAMHQRKDALENLVRLFAAGYHSTPRAPKAEADQAGVSKKGRARDIMHRRTKGRDD